MAAAYRARLAAAAQGNVYEPDIEESREDGPAMILLKPGQQCCKFFFPPSVWKDEFGGQFFTIQVPECKVVDGKYATYKLAGRAGSVTWVRIYP